MSAQTVERLVRRGNVQEEHITVLCMYKSSVESVQELLRLRGLTKVCVCTVDKFQGDGNYVIVLNLV